MSTTTIQDKLLAGLGNRLSSVELIASVLSQGRKDHSSRVLAQNVLMMYPNLSLLSRASPREYLNVMGLGSVRAARLAAAFHLIHHILEDNAQDVVVIKQASDVFERLHTKFSGLSKEVFVVLALDVRNVILEEIEVTCGWRTGAEVHPREVFSPLVRIGAIAAIVSHNHPSGSAEPSDSDIQLTCRLRDAGILMGIPLLDHVVIGNGKFVSLAERGY